MPAVLFGAAPTDQGAVKPMAKTKPLCQVDGCDRVRYARGWCQTHYDRWRNHGDPEAARVHPCGEDHHRAKLTNAIVSEIRSAYVAGATYRALAKQYGVSAYAISCVVRGKTWRHLTVPTDMKSVLTRRRELGRRGEAGASKLTDADVLAIRAAYASGGVTFVELAKQYGVAPATIGNIVRRKTWSHI